MIRLAKSKDSTTVGLEIEAGSVAATEVRRNGGLGVAATAIAPLDPGAFREGEVVDPDAVAESLKALFSENRLSKRVRLGIANQRVIVRTLRLPAIENPEELDAAVRFQAQEQIPMPIDQAILDHRVVGGASGDGEDGRPKIDVVVVAARRDMIEASLEPVRRAGLQPVGVDLSAFGLIRALEKAATAPAVSAPGPDQTQSLGEEATRVQAATLYCHVGDATTLAVAKGGACLFTRVAPAGLESIAGRLGSEVGLTVEHANMWMQHVGLDQPLEAISGDPGIVAAVRGALESGASSLRDELRLSLDFYGAQEGAPPISKVVLGGPGSTIPGLPAEVEGSISCPLEVGVPPALSTLEPGAAARLTLSYGLALES